MDSITQAALGGTLGGLVLGRRFGRRAVLAGAALATLPDLDVVIDYGSAVANFSQHRGFSHSLLILAPLSLLFAGLLSRWKPDVSFRRWWAFTGLILITHPLLDAFTTYGTQLLWPLGAPVAWNTIFIIDPLYTLPLLVALMIALIRPPAISALGVGLSLSCLYLSWTLFAQQWMDRRVEQRLVDLGMEPGPRMIQPMPFSSFLWRATVVHDNQRLEVVTGVFDGDLPPRVEVLPRAPDLVAEGRALADGQRLEWFTGGFLDYHREGDKLVVTDVRLGVPGAHPFQFVIAEADDTGWRPAASHRLPRPMINEDAWPALWKRTFAVHPVLCLDSLRVVDHSEECAG